MASSTTPPQAPIWKPQLSPTDLAFPTTQPQAGIRKAQLFREPHCPIYNHNRERMVIVLFATANHALNAVSPPLPRRSTLYPRTGRFGPTTSRIGALSEPTTHGTTRARIGEMSSTPHPWYLPGLESGNCPDPPPVVYAANAVSRPRVMQGMLYRRTSLPLSPRLRWPEPPSVGTPLASLLSLVVVERERKKGRRIPRTASAPDIVLGTRGGERQERPRPA